MGVSRRGHLVLDSGAVTLLAGRGQDVGSRFDYFKKAGAWPPLVPTAILVECLQGRPDRDAQVNALVKSIDVRPDIPLALARRAAALRTRAGRGSAVDAILVALAEPGGVVVTGDPDDIGALAEVAHKVSVLPL